MLRNILFHLLFTITLVTLLYLGFWQVQRLEWKTKLLQNIADQQNTPPIYFPFDENSKKYEFQNSEVIGNFIHGTKMFFFRPNLKGESGFTVVTGFKTKEERVVYIDIGWISYIEKQEKFISLLNYNKEINLNGVLIASKNENFYSPENDYEQNIWYTMNTKKMNEFHELDGSYYLMKLTNQSYSNDILIEFNPTQIPNNHLQYAGTWFLLFLVISILYFYTIYLSYKKS